MNFRGRKLQPPGTDKSMKLAIWPIAIDAKSETE